MPANPGYGLSLAASSSALAAKRLMAADEQRRRFLAKATAR